MTFFIRKNISKILVPLLLIFAIPTLANPLEDAINALEKFDYTTSLKLFLNLAQKGNVPSQIYLGYMNENGLGTDQNYSEAAKWYALAAKKNDPTAQFNLAHLYFNGLGHPQNFKLAFDLYKKSATLGFAPSQNNLAYMYEKGIGVKINYQKAFFWYQNAAKQNHAMAQISLGYLYENGLGIPKNLEQAMANYEKGLESHNLSDANHEFVKKRLVIIKSALKDIESSVTEAKVGEPSPEKKADNQMKSSSAIEKTEENKVSNKLTNETECPEPDAKISEYSVKKPLKPGIGVFIKANSEQVICVIDGNGDLTKKIMSANSNQYFAGTSPFTLVSNELGEFSIYFQGRPIKLPSKNIRGIKLIEVNK